MGRLGLGIGLDSFALLQGASSPPVDQLRAASPYNYIAGINTALAATHTECAGTVPFIIGSGARKSLAIRLDNWAIPISGANAIVLPGNTSTFEELWLEYNGALTRFTIGGSNTRTLADGEYDVVTDEIAGSFPRGASGFIHYRISVPVAAQKVPTWAVDQARVAALVSKSYLPASTTPTLGLGGWTFAGTAPTTMARTPANITLLGRFVSGDPLTDLGVGDSILAGTFDVSGAGQSPRGMFMRALYGSGGADSIAGITCAVSGGKPDPWFASTNAAAVASLVKYCSRVVCEFNGLNTFATAGAANTFPTGETATRSYWTLMWAKFKASASTATGATPLKILQVKQTPRVTAASVSGASPNTASLDVASQAPYGPQWDLGGDAKKLSDWMVSQVGQAGGPDILFNADALIRASTDDTQADYYKFQAGLNTDLVHFGYLLCPSVGASLRTAMTA